MIRRNLLCQSLSDPPPDVNATPPAPRPGVTTRERLAQHRDDTRCSGCHDLIDGIGLGFEHFDGVGAYRATESGRPIDARGDLVKTRDLDGAFDGVVDLAGKLARSDEVAECVARQWLRFALGRLEAQADACSFRAAMSAFVKSSHNVRELILAIVVTDAFRYRAGEPVAPGP
jgi:hypothetical protein